MSGVPVSAGEVGSQVGRAFPGGEYTIEPWRAWLLADTLLVEPDAAVAHPVMAWMAAVGGMGMNWDDLFAWFGSSAADGPMFGEHRTTLHASLRVGATYRVSGEITSLEHKVGRSGSFDVVGYQMELHDTVGDDHVATCWNSLVLPRRS